MMPRLNWTFLLVFGLIGITFFLFPEIDIKISSLFYDNHFDRNYMPYMIIYEAVRVVTLLSTVTLLVLIVLTFFGKVYAGLNRKNLLFLILALALGPGVIVNAVLKDHWGRARPVQIKAFGGEAEHRPPFILSNQCHKNCSFVCGHASVGFAFIALGFLYKRRQKEIFLASLFAGSVIGFVRIAQGGHFFSDVIFSFFFTYVTIRLLYYFMYKNSDPDFKL
jgi:lipid A 4'-phosphatase